MSATCVYCGRELFMGRRKRKGRNLCSSCERVPEKLRDGIPKNYQEMPATRPAGWGFVRAGLWRKTIAHNE